jgi:hypothetical protein
MATTVDVLDQTLELVKGDSDEYLVNVTEPDAVDPTICPPINLTEAVDGTADRYAILRFAAKRIGSDDENADALVYKTFQAGSSDIRYLTQDTAPPAGTLGQAEVLVDVADTIDSDEPVLERGDTTPNHDWDLEVSRQDEERAGASGVGTVDVINGSPAVAGTGTAFLQAKVGDIINLLDASNLAKPALITAITDDLTLETDRTLWTTVSGTTFELRRTRRRTAAAGDFFFRRGRVKG